MWTLMETMWYKYCKIWFTYMYCNCQHKTNCTYSFLTYHWSYRLTVRLLPHILYTVQVTRSNVVYTVYIYVAGSWLCNSSKVMQIIKICIHVITDYRSLNRSWAWTVYIVHDCSCVYTYSTHRAHTVGL